MMNILYKEEHLSCYNYSKENEVPIGGLRIDANKSWGSVLEESKMLFVLEGRFSISYGNITDEIVRSGQMFILRQGYSYKIDAQEDTFMIDFQIGNQINFCDRFSIEQLCHEDVEIKDEFYSLKINDRLRGFLHWTYINIADGLICSQFIDMKMKELFFLLRAYYPKEDLALLFNSLLNNDQVFSNFVYQNHYKVKNIQQLVALSNYSVSAFNKRFKKSFGVSPYRWMKDQRAKRIFHEINSYQKNFKMISEEYGFSSLSQFNDFCKSHFGLTPGEIRRKD